MDARASLPDDPASRQALQMHAIPSRQEKGEKEMKTPEQWVSVMRQHCELGLPAAPMIETISAIQTDARADETARADKAEAAGAEMRDVLRRYVKAAGDPYKWPLAICKQLYDEAIHIINEKPNLGKGWLPPDKVKVLVEALKSAEWQLQGLPGCRTIELALATVKE